MSSELIIRPARSDDRATVERICAHTWEWGDYIPDVWDEWLADESGALVVGEIGSQIVAVNRISFPAPDQAWLEGMRVDPDFRRRGIARQFLVHALAYARERGAQVARLATGDDNFPVHAMMAQAGMERIGTCVIWIAELGADGPSPAILAPDQAPQAHRFLQDSGALVHCYGLYSFDWAWQELSASRLAELLGSDQVVAHVGSDGSLAALALLKMDAVENVLWIGFVDGHPAAVTTLAMGIRAHAVRSGAQQVRAVLPDLPYLRDAFRATGYDFGYGDWNGRLWVFEHRLNHRCGATP
jgi:GNAT superfamily N-acetyltransferase